MLIQSAPEWEVTQWFSALQPLTLGTLRGRVVLLYAFQMLCPGCVEFSVPQLKRTRSAFAERDLAVVGLHTVFEHHAAMGPASLAAFLHEYRINVPVGIDRADPAGGLMPVTMARYGMQGTPTTVLIDAAGRLRAKRFGHWADIELGAAVQALIAERNTTTPAIDGAVAENTRGCTDASCAVAS